MCGIAGVLSVERPVDAELVAAVLRMLDRQVHRGPDDWGILLPDAAARDPEIRSLLGPRGWTHVRTYGGNAEAPAVVLGSRRLSIIDLSEAGRMPLGSPDGRVWITYNGEIYNHRELRDDLVRRGHVFRTRTDSEVLLAGYLAWGEDVVHRLRGMFAFAILDARGDQGPALLVARDRLGIKPLYWARHAGVFQVASEVRALVAGSLVTREPEPRGFHGFLVYGSVPTPWTTLRGVFALPPAHLLAVDDASYSFPTPRRYWTLPKAGSVPGLFEEAVAKTRRLLDEAVREHLVSDAPLGVFLSGGMDSTAIVALAARHARTPLTTLTVTFDEKEFSEGDAAAATARRHGAKHVDVRARARDFVDGLERFFAAMDQPTIDGVNTWFVARAAREAGLTVALSGVGGDEIFGGYSGFRRAPQIARWTRIPGVRSLAALAGRLSGGIGLPRLEKLEFLREHPLLGPYLAVRGLFPPRRAAALLDTGRLPLWAADEVEAPLTSAGYARLEVAHYLEHQLLRDADVFGMAHSVEIRVPLLDHRLAEHLLGLPETMRAPSVVQKPILAAAVADVALSAAQQSKRGFTLPFERWLSSAWKETATTTAPESPIGVSLRRQVRAFRRRRIHWSRPWALAVLVATRDRGTIPLLNGDSGRGIVFLLPQVLGAGGIPRYNRALLRAAGEGLPAAELRIVSMNDTRPPSDLALSGRVGFCGAGPRGRTLHKLRFVADGFAAVAGSRPRVLVCGHVNLMPVAWLLGRVLCTPTALVAHGIEAWSPPRRLRWFVRRADRVLAVSRYTASRMREWGMSADRITVLPNTVDGEIYRPSRDVRDGRDPVLLTVARLDATERYKGVDRVIEALPALGERWPGIRYVVVGDGDDLERLRSLALTQGVSERIEFRGFIEEERLPRAYGDADLFVMPSHGEGFGIVFLEALACGVPAVGGSRDGSADALDEGRLGKLVDPDDSAGLIAAIVESLAAGRRAAGPRRAAMLAAYGFDVFRARVASALGGPPVPRRA